MNSCSPWLRSTVAASLLLAAAAAQADVVTDWNQTGFAVMQTAGFAGVVRGRALAMMHVAMSDAVNSVQPRYTRYLAGDPVNSKASAEAAAAAAARTVLVHVVPAQKAKVEEAYAASINAIADGAARGEGIALGERVAAAVIAERANDPVSVAETWRPVTTAGVWVPPAHPFPEFAPAKPWAMQRIDQFRPGPPPALTSAVYARDYNETREIGAIKSTRRTQAQTDAVRFWTTQSPGQNFTPAWHHAARSLSSAKGLSVADNARLFALVSVAMADAFNTAYLDTKAQYNFWRPVTAIRNGDRDGNDATERDAVWLPLTTTPGDSEYASGAGLVTGAAAAVVEAVFGAAAASPITVADVTDPKITRQYASTAEMAAEMCNVRVWGGVHFRNSVETGESMGRQIAAYVMATRFRPLP